MGRSPASVYREQMTSAAASWWAALTGVVAAAVVLATSELLSLWVGSGGSALIAVGSAIIDLAPAWVKDLTIALFGTGDKIALFVILGVVLLVLSALAGVLEHRRPPLGVVLLGIGALIGLIAVLTRAGATGFHGVPVVVGAVVGVVVLRTGIDRLRRWELAERPRAEASASVGTVVGPQVERRGFLTMTFVAGALAVVAGVGARYVSSMTTAVTELRAAIKLPRASVVADAVPIGADLDVAGLTSYVTPNADFYRIDTALQVPSVDVDSWRLKIVGMVENEIEIDFAQLLAKPLVEHMAILACVSNDVGGNLIGNALWLGYPIRELLAEARPRAGADMVLSTSIDGFTAGTPLDVLEDEGTQALLAVGMNGQPLPLEHGFPVRMVVPGLYGYVSATKWVVELEVTRFADAEGYWIPRGWDAKGPVKLASRIDTPAWGGTPVTAGERVPIAGVAWDPHVGVAGVEVRIDGGAWKPARLADSVSADTWRQWVYDDWTPDRGVHELSVRAMSVDGSTQSEDYLPPAPNGSEGWHSITVTAT
ncbi:molybdopterin-dependent oxidoreductase [soil metagenome]